MELLERESSLAALDDALERALKGAGQLVLVAGEAGMGKSSLVEAFCQRHPEVHTLVGRCDPIFPPRVLGPLLDLAETVSALDLEGRPLDAQLIARLARLVTERAGILVIEDAQWADGATLDFIVHLGRRLADHALLLVVTYRTDETSADHPMRVALGRLGSGPRRTIELSPLSKDAAAILAHGTELDIDRLWTESGGNPFYLSEVIAAGSDSVPTSIVDGVLARAAQLGSAARGALDVMAVLPRGGSEADVAAIVEDPDSLDQCFSMGLLRLEGERVGFHHEIARRAVEQSIAPTARRLLHGRVLDVLDRDGADPAELAFHARAANVHEAAIRWSLAAGARATVLGANRAAADNYSFVVGAGSSAEARDRAIALDGSAQALAATGSPDAAVDLLDEAAQIWARMDEPGRAARSRIAAARHAWTSGRGPESRSRLDRAIAELDPEDVAAMAFGLAQRASLLMLARDTDAAIAAAREAIALAEPLGETAVLARAYSAMGTASWFTRADDAEPLLERSLEFAHAAGVPQLVATALVNLGSGAGEVGRLATAVRWLDEAGRFCRERDLDASRDYADAWRSRVHLELGEFSQAGALANDVLGRQPVAIARIVALTVVGLVRARRGDPGAREALNEAWELAQSTGDIQRLWPVSIARAEAELWQLGEIGATSELEETLATALESRHPWAIRDLRTWLARSGGAVAVEDPQSEAPENYFERALSWIDEGTESSLRSALQRFDELGATAASRFVRARLRDLGSPHIPRGVRAATARHPAGLTPRQAEIVALVELGLTNEAIAQRLVLSRRTVEAHVADSLRKLGVHSRTELQLPQSG